MHSWRRPGDRFIYDLVVVGSGVEAAVAMRLNANIQACVIRRRFAHAALHDLTNLADFADTTLADDLADHSPDERAQILAPRLAQIRPEVDLYLMTDIAVEDVAGKVSHHFRRVFHAREGALELHLTILAGVADRYSTPFFEALRAYSQRPTGVFHALPISQGKSIVNSHWIRDMVGFYGLDIFLAETSATYRRARLAARADRAAARRSAASSRDLRLATDLLRHERHVDGQQDRRPGFARARRHRPRRPQLSPVAPLRADAGRRRGLLPRRVPAQRVLDVRGGAAAARSSPACSRCGPPASSTGSGS